MTDTGWTFGGFRVIESENAPDPNGIKHLGTRTSDHSPFLSRIVNTCDLHGAIYDVTDPMQNMRAAYDYHTRRSVNTSKERTMTTNHIDQLTEWWENAEPGIPGAGDTVIFDERPRGLGFHVTQASIDHPRGYDNARILHRAPKPKPAWHDAVAVMARFPNMAEGYRELMTRDEAHPDTWHSDHGYGYTEDLRDVTPLIEAKVTDEQVNRVDDLLRAFYGTSTLTAARELVAATLGIEAE